MKSKEDEAKEFPQLQEKASLQVILIMYWLGLVSLLPWNYFITAEPFWDYKLRNVSLGDAWDNFDNGTQTQLQLTFMPALVIISNLACFLFLFVTSVIVNRVTEQMRVVTSLSVMVMVMTLITVLAILNTDSWQSAFYGIVLANVALLNIFQAVFQGSLYGIAGQLPSSCTNAVVSGMGIAGILSSVSNIISLAIGNADPQTSSVIYFSMAVATLVLAIIFYYAMRRNKYYRERKVQYVLQYVKPPPKSFEAYWNVLKKIWWLTFTVAVGLIVTLFTYPNVQTYITSNAEDGLWKDVYFQPTTTFLIFNIGDVMGRELSRWIRWPSADGWLLPVLTCCRLIFTFLFLLCYGENKTFPTLFYSDALYGLINFLFAITGGYVGCLSFVYYPQFVEAEEVELAGTIMGAAVGTGLLLGSCLSPAFVVLWGPT